MQRLATTSRPACCRLLAIAAILALSLGTAACGGGGDGDDPAATNAPADTPAETEPTVAPGETPASESSPAPTAADDDQTFTGRLPDLDSYRYFFKLEGTAGLIAEVSGAALPAGLDPETGSLAFIVEGSYVNPDRGEATITIGDESLHKIVIGEEVWDDIGNGFEGPKQLISGGETDYSFVANFWDSDSSDVLADLTCDSGIETVNGVPTRRCSASDETIARLNQEGKLPTSGIVDLDEFSEASVDLWLSEGDKVIRFRASLAGTDPSGRDVVFKMEADITDINAGFSIDPPD
jgi:hypothetical protein